MAVAGKQVDHPAAVADPVVVRIDPLDHQSRHSTRWISPLASISSTAVIVASITIAGPAFLHALSTMLYDQSLKASIAATWSNG